MDMLKLKRFNVIVENGIVKVFDGKHTNETSWVNGQPVSSYYADTIMEHEDGVGLCLDGGVPEWTLDADDMAYVKMYVKDHPEAMIGFWDFWEKFQDSREEVADLRKVPVIGDNYVDAEKPVEGCVYLGDYYIYKVNDKIWAVDLESHGEVGDRYTVELALAKYAYKYCEVRN